MSDEPQYQIVINIGPGSPEVLVRLVRQLLLIDKEHEAEEQERYVTKAELKAYLESRDDVEGSRHANAIAGRIWSLLTGYNSQQLSEAGLTFVVRCNQCKLQRGVCRCSAFGRNGYNHVTGETWWYYKKDDGLDEHWVIGAASLEEDLPKFQTVKARSLGGKTRTYLTDWIAQL